MAGEFARAAGEWRALLREERALAAVERFDAALALALALFSRSEEAGEELSGALHAQSAEEEQAVARLAFVLRRLLDAVVRDRMAFLLPDRALPRQDASTASASQKEALAQQQAQRDLLPPAFQERFREKLLEHWEELNRAASANKLTLPRVQQLDWKVTQASQASNQQVVLLRLQTSDGGTKSFQVPLREFHRLRYSTAKVLQEMSQVERHPIMRLSQQMNQTVEVAVTSNSGTEATRVP